MKKARRELYAPRRECVATEVVSTSVYDGSRVTRWVFHYDDGGIETVTKREVISP